MLFALPLLPANQILPAYQQLKEKATTEKLINLMDYVERFWINSTVWPVESWCMFKEPLRTNNDVEGIYIYIYIYILSKFNKIF